MPIWPFKRRRSSGKMKDSITRPLTEKAQYTQAASASTPTRAERQRPYKQDSHDDRRDSQFEKETGLLDEKRAMSPSDEKENIHRIKGSVEDITALPISWKLEQSPHLRSKDVERAAIPYNFSNNQPSQSQTSVQQQTLRSKRSTQDSTPQRRRSSKKHKGDRAREEEIRAMSSPLSIPKRQSEGLLRGDSRKRRNRTSWKESTVSLPPQDSAHSNMSGIPERGWEVGFLDVFNPRPAIRLSGPPPYATHTNFDISPSQPVSRDVSQRAKDKRPVTRDSHNKIQRIGEAADELDSSDLRVLLERDTRRREKKRKEQQEKLDRKLRSRAARERRREADDASKAELAKIQAEEDRRGRIPVLPSAISPPAAVHPALRDEPFLDESEAVGLGIGAGHEMSQHDQKASSDRREIIPATQEEAVVTQDKQTVQHDGPQDPFADPLPSPGAESDAGRTYGAFTPLETPMEEDATVGTAQEIRMSHVGTPPYSPVDARRISQLSARNVSPSRERGASLQALTAAPSSTASERRMSESRDRRAGAWASFFRRGPATRKPEDAASPPQRTSFVNTSRESMSRGPIPAHLVGETHQHRSSGTPVRTQSKFREDLPELPMSPPDSRVQSPDFSSAAAVAAAAAAARHAHRSSTPVNVSDNSRSRNIESDTAGVARSDTPMNASGRGQGMMSPSMASVGSEGSWLASGSMKRASGQSALSRMGSLSRRRPDFIASYEELGGDRDADYLQHQLATPSPDGKRAFRQASSPALSGTASLEEGHESDYGDDDDGDRSPSGMEGMRMPVHGSVRRTPTLVHRNPAAKSSEGLLAEYNSSGEPTAIQTKGHSAAVLEFTGSDEEDGDQSPIDALVQDARSVNYGPRHARQMSAGSARLLDLPPSRRQSLSPSPAVSVAPGPKMRPASTQI